MRVEVILQHGWGFDSRMWGDWLPALSSLGDSVILHVGERGYYGAPAFAPSFADTRSVKIVISHSLGAHLLSRDILRQADAVVLISSFLSFHPEDQLSNRRSRRLVQAMKDKLKTAPNAVLADFFQLCYSVDPAMPALPMTAVPEGEQLEIERLLQDLDILDRSDLLGTLDVIGKNTALRLLHGTNDQVVNMDKSVEIATVLPTAQLLLVENGNHALPTLHASTCVETVKQALTGQLEAAYANSSS